MTVKQPATEDREQTAFYLKAKGIYEESMKAYAEMYASAVMDEDPFMAKVCYEELVDCGLLLFLKQGRRFESKQELLKTLVVSIEAQFGDVSSEVVASLQERQQALRSQLFPRGRGRVLFSVDSRLLLSERSSTRTRRARKTVTIEGQREQ